MNHYSKGFVVVTGVTLILWGCASSINGHSEAVLENMDAITADIGGLAAEAYQYKIRPALMGGGGGVYTGYTIRIKLQSNENATYTCTATPTAVTFVGTSKPYPGSTVTAVCDETGKIGSFIYTGQFRQ
jgi:hypothetical protein